MGNRFLTAPHLAVPSRSLCTAIRLPDRGGRGVDPVVEARDPGDPGRCVRA